MSTIIYLRTGHAYRVSDALTLQQVNDAINTSPANGFIEVPLAPNPAVGPGTPGEGTQITHLFVTPSSVSHFVAI